MLLAILRRLAMYSEIETQNCRLREIERLLKADADAGRMVLRLQQTKKGKTAASFVSALAFGIPLPPVHEFCGYRAPKLTVYPAHAQFAWPASCIAASGH
jgi:hypothetical protein